MKPDSDQKITLEDLLRLKRAERPAPEFWVKFDAEIRAKQLSAIVSRPWWDGFARGFAFVSRHQMPLGAAAALALTWVGVQHMETRPVASPHIVKLSMAAPLAATPTAVRVPAPAQLETGPRQMVDVVARTEAAPAKPAMAAASSHLVKAPVSLPPDVAAQSPFSDGLTVTLADYRDPAPAAARPAVFGSDGDFETVAAPVRQTISDPLAQVDPAQERRARLLDSALPANPRAMVSDWIRSRSADDRIYESLDHTSDHLLTGIRF
jgi:hypothetical protein